MERKKPKKKPIWKPRSKPWTGWVPYFHSKCHEISPDLIGRDQSRCAPSQCETSLQCNDVSHWLGAYLDWSLHWSLWKTSSCLLLLISMLWHRQAIFESKGDKLSSSAECRIRTQGLRHLFASRLNACWQTDWAIEDQAKTWTRLPVPMISKHSAHSTSLPVGFRTWLWRYTCLLLLISMLWHRQAIFESKGDKLSSSAECRIRTHLLATRSAARFHQISLAGISLGVHPANVRRRYIVTTSLIGWAHT